MSPADPSRPFTSRALRGHAALDEGDRPLAFETLVMPAVLQTQPLVLGVEECMSVCVCGGKRAGFNRGDRPGGSLSLRQVASFPSPRTPSAGWSAQLEETPDSFSRSLSFCGRKHHKRLSSCKFKSRRRQPLVRPAHQAVGVDLLGLHSFIRRDLLDVLLSFLQPATKNTPQKMTSPDQTGRIPKSLKQ